MRKSILVILLILTLALGACRRAGADTPAPTQPVTMQTEEVQVEAPISPGVQSSSPQPYPYPSPEPFVTRTPRSYPGPQENVSIATATPLVVPTASADSGVVTGKLINSETGNPIAFQSVYLGMKNYLTPGPGYTYTLQENSSPHSLTNEDGEFAIANVPPGEYILMIFTPFGATVVMQPNSDRELDLVVTAGKVLDIGTMEALEPELR